MRQSSSSLGERTREGAFDNCSPGHRPGLAVSEAGAAKAATTKRRQLLVVTAFAATFDFDFIHPGRCPGLQLPDAPSRVDPKSS
jgi:hypothetical protein